MNSTSSREETTTENMWLNLGLNLILPALLLMKGQQWSEEIGWALSATSVLIIALIFPLAYGIYDLVRRSKYNLFSILGCISVLFMGGVGLLELPSEWIAVKEAAIPGLLGIIQLIGTAIGFPLFKFLLYNGQVFNTARIDAILMEKQQEESFRQLLKHYNYWLAASFLISATLNYIIARQIVVSESGTEAFVQELGKMTLWGYVFIALPLLFMFFFIFFRIVSGIRRLTGLTMEEVLAQPSKGKA